MECEQDNTVKKKWVNAQGQILGKERTNFSIIIQDVRKPFVYEVQWFYYNDFALKIFE
jgi:hypothetical protein